jgi:hypothetical protein
MTYIFVKPWPGDMLSALGIKPRARVANLTLELQRAP